MEIKVLKIEDDGHIIEWRDQIVILTQKIFKQITIQTTDQLKLNLAEMLNGDPRLVLDKYTVCPLFQ